MDHIHLPRVIHRSSPSTCLARRVFIDRVRQDPRVNDDTRVSRKSLIMIYKICITKKKKKNIEENRKERLSQLNRRIAIYLKKYTSNRENIKIIVQK